MMTARRFLPVAALFAFLAGACGPVEEGIEPAADTVPAATETMVAQDAPGCFLRGATAAEAAERVSPLDSAQVTLGGAEAKVCYGAPSVNERVIMGELVPYDEPWRAGANEATTLHLTFPAQVAGISVPAGSYSLYTVPSPNQWEVVLNRDWERWGIPINDEVRGQDLGSATVTPESIDDPVETMRFRFDQVNDNEAHLILEWDTTRIRIPVVRTGN